MKWGKIIKLSLNIDKDDVRVAGSENYAKQRSSCGMKALYYDMSNSMTRAYVYCKIIIVIIGAALNWRTV